MAKTLFALAAAAAGLALGGCASLNRLDNEVSTFSQWPAQLKPASYAFERLPSQKSRPERQQLLEDAARPAVEAAGFTPAADEGSADFSIQLGVRVIGEQRSAFDDPFWWRGGPGYPFGYGRWGHGYRYGYGFGLGWGPRYDSYTYNYEREVGLLIRDRKTGLPVFEARANNDALSPSVDAVLPAMFAAALKDFPNGGVNPRRVTIELGQ